MNRYDLLLSIIRSYDSVLVAFSAGVDSTLLLRAVKDAGIRSCAVTVSSEASLPDEATSAALEACKMGIDHHIINIPLLSEADFVRNDKERCFYCKDIIMRRLRSMADRMGLAEVIEGSNGDDISDWRPGMKALKTHRIRSPLMEAGLGKEEIRSISKSLSLDTWDKPSSPCLATRFYYGSPITKKVLEMVTLAERYIKGKGFLDVRVRTNGNVASIEVRASQIPMLDGDLETEIIQRLNQIGFHKIEINREGYRSGRLNSL